MSLRRHVFGPLLVLVGLAVFAAPVAVHWLVGREVASGLAAPAGYVVADRSQRTASLLWDAESDLATVALRRAEATTADRIGSEIEAWLLEDEGFDRLFLADQAQWFDRPRDDAYDADWVRYELVGEGPQYETVAIGVTVFDTDGLRMVPLAMGLGVALAFIGVMLSISGRRSSSESGREIVITLPDPDPRPVITLADQQAEAGTGALADATGPPVDDASRLESTQ